MHSTSGLKAASCTLEIHSLKVHSTRHSRKQLPKPSYMCSAHPGIFSCTSHVLRPEKLVIMELKEEMSPPNFSMVVCQFVFSGFFLLLHIFILHFPITCHIAVGMFPKSSGLGTTSPSVRLQRTISCSFPKFNTLSLLLPQWNVSAPVGGAWRRSARRTHKTLALKDRTIQPF